MVPQLVALLRGLRVIPILLANLSPFEERSGSLFFLHRPSPSRHVPAPPPLPDR